MVLVIRGLLNQQGSVNFPSIKQSNSQLKNQHMKCETFTSTTKKSIVAASKSKVIKLAFLALLMIGAGSMSASAQVYVTVRPVWHPVARPVAPSPRHVWIDEEWEARNGTYVAIGGHWAQPPHPGMAWVPGHWSHGRRGDWWIAGHWRR